MEENSGGPDLLYYDLGEEVVAFSTRRYNGVSEGNYASFNINGYCGDNPLHIAANKKALCDTLCIDERNLIMPHQTHNTRVIQIDETFLRLETFQRSAFLEGVDALITDVPEVCIGVSTADCIPILLYDPEHHAVAAVHAGWRSTVGRIVAEALSEMHRTFHSRMEQIHAVVCPGISFSAFEVGEEVYESFASAGFPMEQIAEKRPSLKNPSEERWFIDLWKANTLQMESRGVLPEQIHVSGICTYNSSDEFFSARRLGTQSGRIFNGILLRKKKEKG